MTRNEVSGADSYEVYMDFEGSDGTWGYYFVWTAGSAAKDVSPTVDATNYRWRVRACNGAGCSGWSAFSEFWFDRP